MIGGIVAGGAAAHGSGIGPSVSVEPAGTIVFIGCASDGATWPHQPSTTCSIVGYPLLKHDATSAYTAMSEGKVACARAMLPRRIVRSQLCSINKKDKTTNMVIMENHIMFDHLLAPL